MICPEAPRVPPTSQRPGNKTSEIKTSDSIAAVFLMLLGAQASIKELQQYGFDIREL